MLGSEGAGKSTQNKLGPKEHRKKMDVLYMYMGSGDGASSFIRFFLKKAIYLKNRFSPVNKKFKQSDLIENTTPYSEMRLFKKIFKLIWAINLDCERRSKIEKINKWKNYGGVIICDRYPQADVMGFNDGPLLYSYKDSNSRIMKKLYHWEYGIYKKSEVIKPDLVI